MLKFKPGNYLTLLLVVVLSLTIAGCKNNEVKSPGGSEGIESYAPSGYSLIIPYPESWEIVKEARREGTLTVQFQDKASSLVMVATITPEGSSKESLAALGERIFYQSLYSIDSGIDIKDKKIAGKEFVMLSALAGEKEKVHAVAAALPGAEESYLFTMMVKEKDYAQGYKAFEAVLEGISFK